MFEDVSLFNDQVALSGISFHIYNETTFLISSNSMLNVLGSPVLGETLRQARYIMNHSNKIEFTRNEQKEELNRIANLLNLKSDVVGMMTRVNINNTVLGSARKGGISVAAICTVEIGNSGIDGLSDVVYNNGRLPGAINIILLIDGKMTDSAMVNAVITGTEAKIGALLKANINIPGGKKIIGTTTDSIIIACTGKGQTIINAGISTGVGDLISKTVYKAVWQGICNNLVASVDYKIGAKQDWLN